MNILYHHRTRGEGAEGIHIKEIFNAFKRNGHNIEMVSLTNKNLVSNKEKLINKKEYNYFKEKMIKVLRKVFALTYNIPGYLTLKKRMSQDTDFIYERYSLYNVAGTMISKKFDIPLILEVNAPYAHEIEEHEKPLFPKFAKKIEKKVFNEAYRIIVVSESLKKYLLRLGVNDEKIIVMHNGVDFKRFNPSISGEKVRKKYSLENKQIIGFIGGLEPHHGLVQLLEAAENLDSNASLLLVGSGSLEADLKDIATDRAIDVIFTGRIPHDEVPEHIAAMDICIKPDANPYCSPMKIFEYMAMKKPIIAGDTSSVREILNDKKSLLVQPSPIDIKNAIDKLINDEGLKKDLSSNAYSHLVENYSWDKNVINVINEIRKS